MKLEPSSCSEKGAINESKKEEEGAFAERQTVWGVDMDTAMGMLDDVDILALFSDAD